MLGLVLIVAGCSHSNESSVTSRPGATTIASIPSVGLPASPSSTVTGVVTVLGSGAETSDTFELQAGDYLIEWAPQEVGNCDYSFELKGLDHDEDPLLNLGGGSSRNGVSVTAPIQGGKYVVRVVTCGL